MGFIQDLFRGKKKDARADRPKFRPTAIDRRFKLHNRIGQGSMSKVWRATDSESGRQVCLKILDKAKLEQLLKRFVGVSRPDEGEVAVLMDHPNLLKTFEHGISTKGEQFLVMEFIEGVGMNFLIETRGKQLQGNELNFLIQAGEGLAHFHSKGYIHRDVCPRNLMVTTENVVKLIDFGLAVPDKPEFRKPGNRTGTANYMAPELIRRSPTDNRIDSFSFGVTVYETLTGSLPWDATASIQAMLDHLNNPGRDPRDYKPDMDDKTARLLLKGVERNPSLRFQTIRHFIDALKELKGPDPDE